MTYGQEITTSDGTAWNITWIGEDTVQLSRVCSVGDRVLDGRFTVDVNREMLEAWMGSHAPVELVQDKWVRDNPFYAMAWIGNGLYYPTKPAKATNLPDRPDCRFA